MQLTLEGISKKVGPQTWLYDMSLAPRSGAVTVLLGATQAGKTSLMRVMAGLDRPGAWNRFPLRPAFGLPLGLRGTGNQSRRQGHAQEGSRSGQQHVAPAGLHHVYR